MDFWPDLQQRRPWYRLAIVEWLILFSVGGIVVLTVLTVFNRGGHPHPTYIDSMTKVRQLNLAVVIYQTENGNAWPGEWSDLLPYLGNSDTDYFDNPREGYSTYALEIPALKIDEIKFPSEVPIIFEVTDDGTVIRDSGVIGYADGHVQYHPAGD